MRYVKLKGAEPGVRYDVLKGQDVYSPRFVNAEEHNTDWFLFNVWCWSYAFVVNLPKWFRRNFTVRFSTMNFLEAFLCLVGILTMFVCSILLVWAR